MKLFGTDGIRGTAGKFPITADMGVKIGAALGKIFYNKSKINRVIIGKDTRISGYMLESAITAGLVSSGMNVILVGPVPTPAVSLFAKSLRASCAVMISASHNLYKDNGLKFFDESGNKFNDAQEDCLETALEQNIQSFYLANDKIGRAKRLDDMVGRYIEFVKTTIPKRMNLKGLKVVLDTANGSCYKIAKEVLWELGAEVISIGDEPNGININLNCGATDTALLKQFVVENNADIGIALDGDGDRIAVVDEKGMEVRGDVILACIAVFMEKQNELENKCVVTTIMTNYGVEDYLRRNGIGLVRTDVGDKNVAKYMQKNKVQIGGEQSGHIILDRDTGVADGLVAAIKVLTILKQVDKKASHIFSEISLWPQAQTTVPCTKFSESIKEKLERIITRHKCTESDVIIRKSGTENVVRVSLQMKNESDAKAKLEIIKSEVEDVISSENLDIKL